MVKRKMLQKPLPLLLLLLLDIYPLLYPPYLVFKEKKYGALVTCILDRHTHTHTLCG